MDTTTLSKAREVSQGKAEAQEKQNDAKTKTTKSKGDEADPPPARSLPGGGFSKPGKTLAVAARPTPTERITLESTAPIEQGFRKHPVVACRSL